jgi:TolA-binding protein
VNEGARPLRLWLMAPLAIGLTALAMGAFAKWQSQRLLTSPSVQSEPVKPAPSQPAPSISHAAPDSPAPSSVQQSLTASPALGSTAVRRGDLRSQELALLDVARAATMAGDSSTALAQIREHEQRFPRGSLVEEREVLKIRALFQAGRKNEAVRAAERMRKRFPRSALLPSVDQMLRNAE